MRWNVGKLGTNDFNVRIADDRLIVYPVEHAPLGYKGIPIDTLRSEFSECKVVDRQDSVIPSVEVIPHRSGVNLDKLAKQVNLTLIGHNWDKVSA